jgi:protein-S-isoprenylcysteine O-methyltransferase Ste14
VIDRVLRLYPRAWRERYGAEMGQLVADLVAAGETTRTRSGLNLLAGAAVAWWRILARRAVLSHVAAVVTIGGMLTVGIDRLSLGGPVPRYTRTHPLGVLFLLVQLGCLLTEGTEFVRGRRSRYWREGPRPDQRAFWWLFGPCILAGTAAVNLAPLAVPAADIRPGTPAFGVGIALILAGTGLRELAFRALDERYCSFAVKVTPDQPLIATGPYRLLRHPGHAGMLLVCVGVGTASANWVGLAVLTVLPLALVLWRARVEETALLATLGDRYRGYAAAR